MLKNLLMVTVFSCIMAISALAAEVEPGAFTGQWAIDMVATMQEMPVPMKEELEKDAGFQRDANSLIVVTAGSSPDIYTVVIQPKGEAGSAGKRFAGVHDLRLVPTKKPAEYTMLFGKTEGGKLRVIAPGKRVAIERAGWQKGIILQKVGQ